MSNVVDRNEAWLKTQNFFFNKFKDKSESYLLSIVNRKANFQPEAVNAAIQILNERYGAEIPFIEDPEMIPANQMRVKTRKKRSNFDESNFRRAFSYREILTAFTMSILYMSYITLISYYSDEESIKDSWWKFVFIGFIATLLFNHVFYNIEHKRTNSYLGRYICDLLFFIFWLALQFIYSFYSGWSPIYQFGELFGIFILFAFLIGFFESLVSFVRYLLRFLGWEIF